MMSRISLKAAPLSDRGDSLAWTFVFKGACARNLSHSALSQAANGAAQSAGWPPSGNPPRAIVLPWEQGLPLRSGLHIPK